MPVTINGTTGIAGVDGSAGTPAVQGSDTNTGIYFPAADTLSASTGGTERMRIDSSGNVGIGTTPSTRLHVYGADTELRVQSSTSANGFVRFLNTSGSMSIGMSGAATNTLLTYDRTNSQTVHEYLGGASGYHAWYTAGSERMRIDSSGNVSVGGTPVTKFDVRGPSGVTSFTGTTPLGFMLRASASTNDYTGIDFSELNGGVPYARIGMLISSTGSFLNFGTSNNYANGVTNTAMTINPSGNVGIGTTSAGNKLTVYGASGVGIAATNSTTGTTSTSGLQLAVDSTTGGYLWNYSVGFLSFGTGASERMRIDASGNVIVGGTSAVYGAAGRGVVTINGSSSALLGFTAGGVDKGFVFHDGTNLIVSNTVAASLILQTNNTERMRITSAGRFLVSTSNDDPYGSNTQGTAIVSGVIITSSTSDAGMYLNRRATDGTLIAFGQDATTEGSISVSGTTVSYNAFAGSHWSQLTDGSKPEILVGTVLESIDEKCVWPGEENDQLAKFKISDTVASKRVYGVFMAWDNDQQATNDAYVTGLGAYLIRIAPGVTVVGGDLLESNGDGCARVQADDTIRSSTIGKVTCNIPTETYADGSYTVPCVLYCG